MRLIDADTLKKALDEQMHFEENCRDSVFDIIDNAPTIEAYTEDDMCVATSNGYDIAEKQYKFDAEGFKKFVGSRMDMQDLYLPMHFFDLLDEYRGADMRGEEE